MNVVNLALAPVLVSLQALSVQACSNFLMENEFMLSVRTMDLGTNLSFGVLTVPQGSELEHNAEKAAHGFLGFPPIVEGVVLQHFISGGINEAGVSCDQQTLLHTVYPKKTSSKTDLSVDNFCEHVLGTYASVAALEAAISNGTITPHGPSIAGGDHFSVRDASGSSAVIEFLDGKTVFTLDQNDAGETGFGIMTNEPNFDWHVENARHAAWKLHNKRSAVVIPGNFYPDARCLRINFLKSAMPKPASFEEAMMQAVHVLNSITVPMGEQMGTDSSKGEGAGDHTKFGVVYDHLNATLYWRSERNQNLQRLRLSDAHLAAGSNSTFQEFIRMDLPWFSDAASTFFPPARQT